MSLILDGTNGLSDVDGTAGTPAIRGSDANTGVFFGTDIVGVSTGGSERMRVDASGNVGIGTSSPTVKLDVLGASGASTIYSRVTGTTSADSAQMQCVNGSVLFQAYAYSSAAETAVGSASNHPLLFRTNSIERVRIDTSGNLLMGGLAALPRLNNGQLSVNGLIAARASAIPGGAMDGNLAFGGSTGSPVAARVYFGDGTGWQWNWGPVLSNGTFSSRYIFNDAGAGYNLSGTWGSISDARLKENVTDATPKLNDLLNLRVRNFNFIAEPSKKQIGFIAQEVEEVFPGLVDTPKPDENGNAMKAVKISVLVPMLVKAIQELKAINDAQAQTIESLTARVVALEGQA